MWSLVPKIWQTQSSKYLRIMILVNSKGLLRFMISQEGNEFRSAFLLLANFRQIPTWKIWFWPIGRIFHEKNGSNSPDLGKKILPIARFLFLVPLVSQKYRNILIFSYFHISTCDQIWLNHFRDDTHLGCITKLEKETLIQITHNIRSWFSVFIFKYFFHWLNLHGNTNRGNELQHLRILFFIIPSWLQVELSFKCHEKNDWQLQELTRKKESGHFFNSLRLFPIISCIKASITSFLKWSHRCRVFLFQFSDNFVNLAIFSTTFVNFQIFKFLHQKIYTYPKFPPVFSQKFFKKFRAKEKKSTKFVSKN
jgi:hypothetical protein